MPIQHTIEEGESVISLSEQYGLFAGTIWDDPANQELRSRREDMNVLLPGDVLVIPDKRLKMEKRAAGSKYRFRRKGIPARFRFQVFDMNTPRANETYTLTVDGAVFQGTTDDKGILQEFIPAQAKEGELVVGEDEFRIALKFGDLDPLGEIPGIKKRLVNLGYDCGELDDQMNDETTDSLSRFQRANGLDMTGQADDATRNKLKEIHDLPYDFPDDGGPAGGSAS